MAGAGSRLPERSRLQPVCCECSPFCHPNKLSLAQKSKLSNSPNLSNGKGDNSAIMDNNSKICHDRTVNLNFQFRCPYDQNKTWN
jgi:hypothetical protein